MTKNAFGRGRRIFTTKSKIKLAACLVWVFAVISLVVYLGLYYG